MAIVNLFTWPIGQFTEVINSEKLALVNNFAMAKKFLNAKFDWISNHESKHFGVIHTQSTFKIGNAPFHSK